MKNPNNGWIVAPQHLDETILAVISAEFDEETDAEEAVYEAKQKKESNLRKFCILVVLNFPIDFIVGTAMYGRSFGKRRFLMILDMVKFIFKRCSSKQVLKSIEDNI